MNYNIFLLFLCFTSVSFAQVSGNKSEILETTEVNTVFSKLKKQELKIKYPIVRVFKYEDRTGKNYLVLTERKDVRKGGGEEIRNDSIQAFNFREVNGTLMKEWSLNDYILKDQYAEENSIWFWTKYIEVKDYDNDGFMEPIILYGTSGDDDRMKMLVYHKDKKKGIRHQNASLDDERVTQVDKSVFELPLEIRKRIKSLLLEIKENGHTNFNTNGRGRFQFEKRQLLVPN